MFNKFKITALAMSLLFFSSLNALDTNSADNSSSKSLAQKIVESLKIPDLHSKEAIDHLTEDFVAFLEDDWYYYYNSNDSLSASKVVESPFQYVDLTIINNNRITTYQYIYFPDEKQIHVSRKQFVPAGKDVVLDLFEERKKDKEYKQSHETDYYASYAHNTTTSRVTYHVKDNSAMVNYSSLYSYNLGDKK